MKKKFPKIIIIAIGTIILVTGLFIAKNPIEYSMAQNDFESKDYDSAAKRFYSLGSYKDAYKMYQQSMTFKLTDDIEAVTNNKHIADFRPVEYGKILDECQQITCSDYYKNVSKEERNKVEEYIEYMGLLNYLFNYDSEQNIPKVNCKQNNFIGENLNAFYDEYYEKYEDKSWKAKDEYICYDDKVTTAITVETRVLLKLKNESKGFSDDNFEGYIRAHVSLEEGRDNSFSESEVVPVSEIESIKVKSDKNDYDDFYDTERYKKEMGGLDVRFVINLKSSNPTIKYVPDYYEHETVHTLELK